MDESKWTIEIKCSSEMDLAGGHFIEQCCSFCGAVVTMTAMVTINMTISCPLCGSPLKYPFDMKQHWFIVHRSMGDRTMDILRARKVPYCAWEGYAFADGPYGSREIATELAQNIYGAGDTRPLNICHFPAHPCDRCGKMITPVSASRQLMKCRTACPTLCDVCSDYLDVTVPREEK